MDATTGPSLHPLHRTKTLHLVRHAQGIHNVEGEKDHAAYMSYDLFDAHLTPLGWSQIIANFNVVLNRKSDHGVLDFISELNYSFID
ncbi:hypothetical protein PS1_044589 [Malus domestica]